MRYRLQYILQILLPMFMATLAAGCGDDGFSEGTLSTSVDQQYLILKATTSPVSAEASRETVTVYTHSTPWKLSLDTQWLSLTPTSGNSQTKVTMDISENTNPYASRTAILMLNSATADWPFSTKTSITQTNAKEVLQVEAKDLNFTVTAAANQTIKVPIKANCKWRILDLTQHGHLFDKKEGQGDGVVTIQTAVNNTGATRESQYEISNYDRSIRYNLIVTQMSGEITTTSSSIECDNMASAHMLNLESNVDWQVSCSSWISVTPQKGGAGASSVKIEVSANEGLTSRTGEVLFKSTAGYNQTVYKQIIVTQKGATLEAVLSPSTFSSKTAEARLTVKSSTNWTVASLPAWVTLGASNGVGNVVLGVRINDNPYAGRRTGYIILQKPGTDLNAIVPVEQEGRSINISENLLQFGADKSERTYTVLADNTWYLYTYVNWLNTRIEEETKVTAGVNDNNTTIPRSTVIRHTYALLPGVTDWNNQANHEYINLPVEQEAKFLKVSNEALQFDSKGGEHKLSFTTNDKWSVQVENNADWIELSKREGTGSDEITIRVADNSSVNPRSAKVLFYSEWAGGVVILVNQSPRKLTVSNTAYFFYEKGGEDVLTVSSDGMVSVTCSESWFSVDKTGDNSYKVSVTENVNKNLRTGKIIVKMTDLKEGALQYEIPVYQVPEGGTYLREGFTEDRDLDTKIDPDFGHGNFGEDKGWHEGDKFFNLSVTRYVVDTEWLKFINGEMGIKLQGFSTEKDYNRADIGNSQVSLLPYGVDESWINSGNISEILKMLRYGYDIDYFGTNGSTTGGFGLGGYGSDNGSGNNGSGSGNIGQGGFGSDNGPGNNGSGSGNIGQGGFGSDSGSGNNGSGSGNIGQGGFGSDSGSGNNGSGSGNIGQGGYRDEKDINKGGTNGGTAVKNGFSKYDTSYIRIELSTGTINRNRFGTDRSFNSGKPDGSGTVTIGGFRPDSQW